MSEKKKKGSRSVTLFCIVFNLRPENLFSSMSRVNKRPANQYRSLVSLLIFENLNHSYPYLIILSTQPMCTKTRLSTFPKGSRKHKMIQHKRISTERSCVSTQSPSLPRTDRGYNKTQYKEKKSP